MVIGMKALISKIEPVESGWRVAQVVMDGHEFPVAADLFWSPCSEDVVADQFWYDPTGRVIKPIAAVSQAAPQDQPAQTGAEEL